MDENGLEDHSSPYASGCLIPWENVASIKMKSVLFEKYIAVELLADDPLLNKMHWMKRLLIYMRKGLGYTTFCIPVSSVGGQVGQVLETARFYMEQG